MTGVNIDDMSAGPEINALIAEKIMNWCVTGGYGIPPRGYPKRTDGRIGSCVEDVPPFSTDITAALEMEAELCKMSAHIQVGYVSRLYEILNIPFSKPMPLSTKESLKLIRATPEQRCRAALKAVMGVY